MQQPKSLIDSPFLRGIILVFVLASCLRAWLGPAEFTAVAEAQIPDGGLQRKQLLDEARVTNQLLAEIKGLLQTGTLNVRVQGADNQALTRPPAPGK